MDDQEFVKLLGDLLEPDTNKIKAATATLKKNYYTSPASLNALLNVLVSNQETKLRQLAAVEARKLVPKHWPSIPNDQKTGIRNQLLQATLAEEQTLIRHSSARVITAIAALDLEDGEWTDLPGLLSHASTSDSARHREVGVYILYCLMEASPELFEKDMANMFTLFSKTVEDPESSEVRANTMLALGRIASVIDSQEDDSLVEPFQALVPKMVGVLKDSISADDEVQAMKAFEVFQMLLQCDSALLSKHFRDLLNFMIEMGCQSDLDDDFRTSAFAFLTNAVRSRKMKVQGLRIGGELAEKALSVVPEMGDMPTEEEEIVPATSALALLDIMASSLPPNQVVVPLLNKIGPFITNESADHRRGGLLALSMLVEGAPDFFSTQLNQILPMLLQLLQAPEAKVRSAALKCLSRLADDLATEMANQHATLIPAVIHSMDMGINAQNQDDDWNLELIRHSCVALDALVDGLDKPDAAKYVSELVPRLSKLFQHSNIRVQHGAICAIGSLAAAAGDAFLPHFQTTMQSLGSYITLKDTTEEIDLRATACDAIGRIAGSAGPENFNPFVGPLMQSSEEALNLDNSHLREMTYVLWAALAKVYGADFAPYLQGVVTGLHDCLKQKEDMDLEDLENLEDLEGKEISLGGHKLKIVANDDEDGDMDDSNGETEDWEDVTGITGVAMEKEMAIEALGDIISHTKDKFLPHLEETIELLGGLVDHDYEGVRRTAIGTMWRAYATAWGIAEANGMAKWKPGFPLQVQPPADINKIGNAAMSMTLQVWGNEEDMTTVADINTNMTEVFKTCGPAPLMRSDGTAVPDITNILISILTKRHLCQQDIGEDGDEVGDADLEGSSEYDWYVIDTALDTIGALSIALGNSFGELWKVFEKSIFKFCSSSESIQRNSAVGIVAECVSGMGAAVTPYTDSFYRVLLHRLGDEDSDVKSNAVFAMGVLLQNTGDEASLSARYGPVLQKLEPIIEGQPKGSRLVDNSAGCVSRLISRNASLVPLGDVLPRLVELLPLHEDLPENVPVFKMIVKLYREQNSTVQGLTPQLMPILEKVAGPPEEQLDEETRAAVVELLKYIKSS